VLTNAVLLRGRRLERLAAIANGRLVVQVSLDGARPEHHDPYRGRGTWVVTVEAIRRLQDLGLKIRLSTTETPVNSDHLEELHAFRRSLGIAAEDHVLRPLARRGFAEEGVEVNKENLLPEVTVSAGGVYWHPLASPSSTDLQISRELFPLARAVDCIRQQFDQVLRTGQEAPQAVT
jgi:sulfatase maturation enzyme AslB (radical SAM superfamily)